jgi:peptidoglycan/LPS O-acetylase OafA/YrhL
VKLQPGIAGGEIASLNGIRALAVMMVFFSHGSTTSLIPGGLGVTIFFVLSGYLITTLMQREFAASDRIALGAFYLRRAWRLMPPLLVVVAIAGLLSSLNLIDGRFSLRGLLSVLFYFGNYHVIAFDFGGLPVGMGVVWSLAVEEHYYLLYPPLALLLLRSRRRWLASLVLIALCIAILAWRYRLAAAGGFESYLSMATDTRADAILIGCLLAFWSAPSTATVTAASALPLRSWLLLGACLAVLLTTLLYRDESFRLTARYTLQALAIAPLIALAVRQSRSAVFRWLNSAPMHYLGTLSYTIYLSHQLILYGVIRQAPQLNSIATLAVSAVLTLALAEAVRRWVEQPLRRRRQKIPARQGDTAGLATAR